MAPTKTTLPMIGDTPSLARFPEDDFVVADPYPMSPRYRAMLRKIIEALCPPPPAPNSQAILDDVERHVRCFMMYMHPLTARGLWVIFLVLDLVPLFYGHGFRRLQNLERDQAADVLDKIAHANLGPLRLGVVGVRGSILAGYFDHPEVHEALSYRPVPFMRERMQLRAALLEDPKLEETATRAGEVETGPVPTSSPEPISTRVPRETGASPPLIPVGQH